MRITSWSRYWTAQSEELLDPVLTSADKFIIDLKTGVGLGCSSHCTIEFVNSRNIGLGLT